MMAANPGHVLDVRVENHQVRPQLLYTCGIQHCPYVARHVRRIIDHIFLCHRFSRNMFLECCVHGCLSRLNTPDSYRTHLTRHHKQLWETPVQVLSLEEVDNVEELGDDIQEYGDVEVPHQSSDDLYTELRDWVKGESLLLRLKMEHVYEVPASTVNDLHSEMKGFVTELHLRLERTIKQRLKEAFLKDEILEDYVKAEPIMSALHVTKTQAKKRLSSMTYVAPKRIKLQVGSNNETSDCVTEAEDEDPDNPPEISNATYETVLEMLAPAPKSGRKASGVMHYVPILETLKAYLKHDDVVQSIRKEGQSNHLDKYTAGILFKTHPVFKNNPNALRIILYMDELEVCNPLGSARGKHKVTVVYFSLGNLEQHYLSSLSAIHLALVCEYPNVEKYGYDEILKPILSDLKILQTDGISVVTHDGEECSWIGSLAFVCGDNATQNDVGGFRRCFSSGKMCRFCLADYDDLSNLVSEDMCTLRTPLGHLRHVEAVADDPTLIPTFGVTGRSPFLSLGIGSPVEILCPDLLHEILEGLMCLHVKKLVRQLHQSNTVKLKVIIDRIAGFQYGKLDRRNKHPGLPKTFLRKKVNVIGSASQKWTLFHILPLAIGDLVPEDNRHWQLFLLATKLCELIFAPALDFDWVATLQLLIEEHHELWQELYPGVATFKWHVLLHYARLFWMLGPLRHVWTMRYEAFHQFFKRVASKLQNFICISKSFTERFQRKRCMEFAGSQALPPDVVFIGRDVTSMVHELSQLDQDALISRFNCERSQLLLKCRGVKYRGVTFVKSCFVIVKVCSDGAPVFLKINSICVLNGEVLLLGCLSFVAEWLSHVNAYKLKVSEESEDYVCIKADEVVSPQSLDGYCIGGATVVKLRFRPLP